MAAIDFPFTFCAVAAVFTWIRAKRYLPKLECLSPQSRVRGFISPPDGLVNPFELR